MKDRISFYTIGCRLNHSETAVLQQSFELKGYVIVDFKKPADIVVVNTCTVTERGDADTRRIIHKIIRINPKARIALVGCQAQIQKEKLSKFPNICCVVGNARKLDLVNILNDIKGKKDTQVIVPPISSHNFSHPVIGIDKHHTRANLKIQDGCDAYCSYCEIPYARGHPRSRVFEDITREAQNLVQAGHKEIVLTGINVGNYQFEGKTLVDIIDSLKKINGLLRLRISSIESTTIKDDLIDRMEQGSKLCRFVHVPMQSGSDKILNLMNRKYKISNFRQKITKIHQRIPFICIGTDIIVGFPGEEEKDFQETFRELKALPFSYFHVFSYSQRYMAKSKNLPNPVSQKVIQERSFLLRELSSVKREQFLGKLMGKKQAVLFEQKKKGSWFGLTDNYVRVKVQSENSLKNKCLFVKLTGIEGPIALGELA